MYYIRYRYIAFPAQAMIDVRTYTLNVSKHINLEYNKRYLSVHQAVVWVVFLLCLRRTVGSYVTSSCSFLKWFDRSPVGLFMRYRWSMAWRCCLNT